MELESRYPIYTFRIYVTGLSEGTIRAIAMLFDKPDLFGGAMLVAGQGESGYASKLAQPKA